MAWSIEFEKGVEKQLLKLSPANRRRVTDFLDERIVTGNPRTLGQAMQGRFAGLWRYRVGDYRIVARIKDHRLVVAVVDVGHRGDVYR